MSPRPRALLLDFGGVIVMGKQRSMWTVELAETVHTLLRARNCPRPDTTAIISDLTAGFEAYSCLCDAMSRPYGPAQLTHEAFWADFVAPDWPAAAREVVLAHASTLARRMGEVMNAWELRPGILGLVAEAADRGVLLAVVSNTLCGAVHREYLERVAVADRFSVQMYSDEAGVRKPNPELILRATRALGVNTDEAWFVGDTYSRDVQCGRRAGVGRMIVMRSERTDREPFMVTAEPDYVVDDAHELRMLLSA